VKKEIPYNPNHNPLKIEMMTNTCNYSDDWQPYIGDYDKFEYDIKLHDGTIVESCYPNAGKFNSFSKEHDGQYFQENDVAEIRFANNRVVIIENKFTKIDLPEYNHEAKKVYEYHMVKQYEDIGGLTKRQQSQVIEPVRSSPKILNNDPCPCGSGMKYKKCCKK